MIISASSSKSNNSHARFLHSSSLFRHGIGQYYNKNHAPKSKQQGSCPLTLMRCTISSTANGDIIIPESFLRQKNRERLYTIEKVTSRARALDVEVFRGFSSVTAKEWIIDKKQQQAKEITTTSKLSLSSLEEEEEAILALTPRYDDHGSDKTNAGEPLVTFIAIYEKSSSEQEVELEWMVRTNGVVGSVDCKVKHNDPNGKSSLPYPHVNLKNLRVDVRCRRMGMGSGLFDAVKQYTLQQNMKYIVLEVDPENKSGAIELYQQSGFDFVPDLYCVMVLRMDNDNNV